MQYLTINGRKAEVYPGDSILDVAKRIGVDIPTLCHDERVETYGACGLCVVEAEGMPKLLRACSTEARADMVIRTETERVNRSRRTALELLLSDHRGDCKAPCVRACPGHTDCQGYVGLIANKQYKEALKLIKEQLPLPASIGRVCPHPCETACRREMVEDSISIAHLKSFVADLDLAGDTFLPEKESAKDKTVGIIGGGPGGLTLAYFLSVKGYPVTIYDKMPEMGGMLRYGIPEYRLPKAVLQQEINIIEQLGTKFINSCKIGEDMTLDELREKHDAVYIAVGAWESSSMRAKGEEMPGVMGGIDFLRQVALGEKMELGDRVAIVGGGNTAMDACRTAVRLGAKDVRLIYRRTRKEMPAEEIEIVEAEEEGVNFQFLASPIEVLGENGKAAALRLQKMELGEPDDSGRRRPVPIPGDEEIVPVDTVIAAIGQRTDTKGLTGIATTPWGTVQADESTFLTNLDGVFAGGDCINDGADIAIKAIGDAKIASELIAGYLEGEMKPYRKPFMVIRDEELSEEDFKEEEIIHREVMAHLSPEERKDNFKEINFGFTPEQATAEGHRCLECGCFDQFECKLYQYSNRFRVNEENIEGEKHHREEETTHPYIIRNADKCILCGLCVRICSETMHNGALGLVNRGFDTIMEPSFGMPLEETQCISCGQCVHVCPVGALTERPLMDKAVPLEGYRQASLCTQCGLACDLIYEEKGDFPIRALPKLDGTSGGLLCKKGRFQWKEKMEERELLTVEEILAKACEQYGRELQVTVDGNHTLELVEAICNEAKTLGLPPVRFGGKDYTDLREALGEEWSWEKAVEGDVLLILSKNLEEKYPLMEIKMKQAKFQGAEVITLEDDPALFKEKSQMEILNMLKEANHPVVILDMDLAEAYREDLLALSQDNPSIKWIFLYPDVNSRGVEAYFHNRDVEAKSSEKIFAFGKEKTGQENTVYWDGFILEKQQPLETKGTVVDTSGRKKLM